MKCHLPTSILEPRTWRYLLLQEFKKRKCGHFTHYWSSECLKRKGKKKKRHKRFLTWRYLTALYCKYFMKFLISKLAFEYVVQVSHSVLKKLST